MQILDREPAATSGASLDDEGLHVRIRAEFREMPGLKLTIAQASRLFDVERNRCARALGRLVRDGHLTTDGTSFGQRADGRASI